MKQKSLWMLTMLLACCIPYDLNTTEEKVEFYERRIIPLVYWLNEVETFKKNRKLREEAAQNNQPYNYDELVANIEDVEVHQGKTKDDATTSLSTVNATKIDKK